MNLYKDEGVDTLISLESESEVEQELLNRIIDVIRFGGSIITNNRKLNNEYTLDFPGDPSQTTNLKVFSDD